MYSSFIGNLTAALDICLIEKYSITHILTVDSCPLPSNILVLPSVTTKFFQSNYASSSKQLDSSIYIFCFQVPSV